MKNLKLFLSVLFVSLFSIFGFAQMEIHPEELIHPWDTVHPHSGTTIYQEAWDMIGSNEAPSYAVFPGQILVDNESLDAPITVEEGAKGAKAELGLNVNYPVIRGGRGLRPLFNTGKIDLTFGSNIRVIRASSSPILPPTVRFGMKYDQLLFWKVGKNKSPVSCFSTELICPAISDDLTDIKLIYLSVSLEHFSNGQNAGVFVNNKTNRNDYLNGDFSTNYLRNDLVYTHQFDNRKKQFTFSAGYQWDFGVAKGLMAFHPEQENRYGHHRLRSMIQYKAPWLKGELAMRFEIEHILDGTELFPGSDKFKNSRHFYILYNHEFFKSVGLMFHYFRGRDYLNIRYDTGISTFQIGISMKLPK